MSRTQCFACGAARVVVAIVVGVAMAGAVQAQAPPQLDALSSFIRHWIDSKQTGTYVPEADLNGDHVIDHRDAVLAVEDALRGPAILSPQTVVLPADGSVTAVVVSDNEVRLKGKVPTLKPGQILAGAQNSALLHKVQSVSQQGGEVIVRTTRASVAEAVQQGSFRLLMPPPENAPIQWSPQARPQAARSQAVRPQALGGGINLGDITLSASADGQSRVRILDGRLDFCPSIDIGGHIEDFRLTEFHASATGKLTLAATVRFENRGSVATEAEIPLCSVPLGEFEVQIGPLPVWVSPVLEFSIGYELGSSGFTALEQEFAVEFSTTLGACYNNGTWAPIAERKFDCAITPKELNVAQGLWGRIFVKPALVIYFYHVLGPGLDLDLYAKGDLSVDFAQRTWELAKYLGMQCDVLFEVTILDWHLLSWDATILGPYEVALGASRGSLDEVTRRPRVYLTVDDLRIPPGGSTTLRWSATNATRVVQSNFGAAALEGALRVSPPNTTAYTLTVEGPGGQATAVALVVVGDDTGEGATSRGFTTRVSVATDGTEGNNWSLWPSMSADGRYVAFESLANNLVPGDTNRCYDVFVHDRLTGQTTRVSVASSGQEGNGGSYAPCISADGRSVTFLSSADNLVPGDTNGYDDVFVHDRLTGQTTRVSVASSGQQASEGSFAPRISADGRYVAFESDAPNLVAGDTNHRRDIFVHDCVTGQTTRVSVSSSGEQANADCYDPAISADGRYVAFWSRADNLVPGDTNLAYDVFVHDRLTGQTTRVSVATGGGQANDNSDSPSLSADGRYVAFVSHADNLVGGDTNHRRDIFVHDCATGQTTRVSVSSRGAQGNNDSWGPSISADGRYVTFTSYADNLVPGDTNGQSDVFVHDRLTGTTTRVSAPTGGGQGDSLSGDVSPMSADGRYVAFVSNADNLVPRDTNGGLDVFVHDRWPWLAAVVRQLVSPSGRALPLLDLSLGGRK
jgi:Tol biopolymer transport system component